MPLTFEKGIRDGICHLIHKYAKASNKYMKNYDKDTESSYLEYLDERCLEYLWMSNVSKTSCKCFWVEELSQFKEDFMKNHDENSNKGYFLEVDGEYSKNFSLM